MEFEGAESFLQGSKTFLSNQSRPEIRKVQVAEYRFYMRGKKKKRGQELSSTSSCIYSLIDACSNILIITARRCQKVTVLLLKFSSFHAYFRMEVNRLF